MNLAPQTLLKSQQSDPYSTLKLKQSLAYQKTQDDKPTVENVRATGAVFVDVSDQDIEQLRSKVSIPSTLHASVSTPEFVENIGLQGLLSLRPYLDVPDFLPCEVIFSDAVSSFDAIVATNDDGKMVCTFHSSVEPSINLAKTVIHEIVGHALHFT